MVRQPFIRSNPKPLSGCRSCCMGRIFFEFCQAYIRLCHSIVEYTNPTMGSHRNGSPMLSIYLCKSCKNSIQVNCSKTISSLFRVPADSPRLRLCFQNSRSSKVRVVLQILCRHRSYPIHPSDGPPFGGRQGISMSQVQVWIPYSRTIKT